MSSLYGLATKIFGELADRYESAFTSVKQALLKSDIKIPFRSYLSLAFFIALLSYISSLIALAIAMRIVQVSLALEIIYYIFVPIIIAVFSFFIVLFYPVQRMMSRRKSIETNLPFALTHMGSIAESGVPPYVIFKLLAEFEEYGEISKEMKKIVRNIDVFGMDLMSAVKEVVKRTPSEAFKQALMGIVTTTESGGNLKLYLKNIGEQALFNWKMRRAKFIQQLSAYAEFYTGIIIAAPLFIVALFSVMGMIQPTIMGFGILELTKLGIYVAVPMINLVFLLFLRTIEVEM